MKPLKKSYDSPMTFLKKLKSLKKSYDIPIKTTLKHHHKNPMPVDGLLKLALQSIVLLLRDLTPELLRKCDRMVPRRQIFVG